jgi:hypothetical protein
LKKVSVEKVRGPSAPGAATAKKRGNLTTPPPPVNASWAFLLIKRRRLISCGPGAPAS